MYKKRDAAKEYKGFFGRHINLVATSTLVGTVVGAGILGIPYAVSQAGFLYGLILIALIGFAFVFLNLFMGEIVLRTKKQFQLTGYATKYLGKKGKILMTFSMLFGIYGALTAYLIGEGAALKAIFGVGDQLIYTLIFFLIAFLIIYQGMRSTGKAEFILICFLLLVVVFIGILSFDKINSRNFSSFNPELFFLPYGVIIFAYLAAPAIPEMQEILGKHKEKMRKAIVIGSLVPIFLYLLFTIVIVGLIGRENFSLLAPNERIATVALSIYSNPLLSLFANFLASLAMFTSFLTLGIALVELYVYDYGFKRFIAFLLTFSLPLAIVLFELTTFISVLTVTGTLAGGLEGVLLIFMYWQSKKKGDREPEYRLGQHWVLGSLLILVFTLGVFYHFWSQFF